MAAFSRSRLLHCTLLEHINVDKKKVFCFFSPEWKMNKTVTKNCSPRLTTIGYFSNLPRIIFLKVLKIKDHTKIFNGVSSSYSSNLPVYIIPRWAKIMIQGLERGALVIPKEIYQVNIVMQTSHIFIWKLYCELKFIWSM